MTPLLPPGCYDLLPPHASADNLLLSRLLARFEANGYALVNPPLLEYTESLLLGRGEALSQQMFRVMDPHALKVMGIRPDITLQIARIAATRLKDEPLPLRLSYGGNVLRMKPEGASNARQLRQAGIELIGASSVAANAEVLRVAAQTLAAQGLKHFTIELHLPGLAVSLLEGESEAEAALHAMAQRDADSAALARVKNASALRALIEHNGQVSDALPRLLPTPGLKPAKPRLEMLAALAETLSPQLPEGVNISVDAAETGGADYHAGIGFALFAPGASREIGRGGSYRIEIGTFTQEATGFTLYLEALRHLLPTPPAPRKVLVVGNADASALQAEGFVTVHALPGFPQDEAYAHSLGCTYVWQDGKLSALA